MNPIALQIAVAVLLIFLSGVAIGWFALVFFRHAAERACRHELQLLNQRHARLRENLEQQTVQLEHEKTRRQEALQRLKESDYGAYERLRTELEQARTRLDRAIARLRKREQQIRKLIDLVRLLRGQLKRQQAPTAAARPYSGQSHPPGKGTTRYSQDDLLALEGMTHDMAHKLRRMGILSYWQLAGCGPEQLKQIQLLTGQTNPLSLTRWVKAARQRVQERQDHEAAAQASAQPLQSRTA